MEHGTEWVGESWDELKFIRQVCCVDPLLHVDLEDLEDFSLCLHRLPKVQQLVVQQDMSAASCGHPCKPHVAPQLAGDVHTW